MLGDRWGDASEDDDRKQRQHRDGWGDASRGSVGDTVKEPHPTRSQQSEATSRSRDPRRDGVDPSGMKSIRAGSKRVALYHSELLNRLVGEHAFRDREAVSGAVATATSTASIPIPRSADPWLLIDGFGSRGPAVRILRDLSDVFKAGWLGVSLVALGRTGPAKSTIYGRSDRPHGSTVWLIDAVVRIGGGVCKSGIAIHLHWSLG